MARNPPTDSFPRRAPSRRSGRAAGAPLSCQPKVAVTPSIVHIGLPLDHPSIPPEERRRVAARLRALHARMTRAGYAYEILHAAPETGLDEFTRRLRTGPCDGVLIGGGVAGDPAMAGFLAQIVDATRQAAPAAKVMVYDHAVDVQATVDRALGPATG